MVGGVVVGGAVVGGAERAVKSTVMNNQINHDNRINHCDMLLTLADKKSSFRVTSNKSHLENNPKLTSTV